MFEGVWWVASMMTNTDVCHLLVMLWVIFPCEYELGLWKQIVAEVMEYPSQD